MYYEGVVCVCVCVCVCACVCVRVWLSTIAAWVVLSQARPC